MLRSSAMLLIVTGLLLVSGCVGNQRKGAQMNQAYSAGRMEALQQLQMAQGPTVAVFGPVEHPVITWVDGLTLADAIIQSRYMPEGDPFSIVIVRNNLRIPFDPRRLLRGENMPLEPGDIIEIRP